MATTALVQAHIDPELKAEAEKILAEEGLTLSDALRMLLVATVQNRGEYKSFDSVEVLMADPHADD